MSRTLKVTCSFCGDEFLAERSSAKFCTPKHRIAYNRLEGRIERLKNAALDYVWDIKKLAEDHPHMTKFAETELLLAQLYISDARSKLLTTLREDKGSK